MVNQQETGAAFFVATDGDDGWSGSLAEPNAERTDGPFATLARARDAVREMKGADNLNEPVSVMVRGGKYYLEDPLVLGPRDSGTRDCPVTYTAYPDEKPVLSGGRKVSGWKPYKDKILQCPLPGTKGGKWKFRQLFLNGQRQIRARFPKFDPDKPLYGGWAFTESLDEAARYDAFKYNPGIFPRHWEKPTEGEVYLVHNYGVTNIMPIKAIDEENCVITLVNRVISHEIYPWYIKTAIASNYRFYVENVLEELGQPGEWCVDSEEGILYYWPPTESIEEAEVVAPVLDCLVDLCDASFITISGFTFTETTTGEDMHRPGHEGQGPMCPMPNKTYCGEALHMRGVEHCCIENNHFYAVGGNGIYLEDYNARNLIQHNEISYAGACGVCLVGSKYSHPVPHHPVYNQVVDNHIHHCGIINKYVAAVFLGLCDGNVIGHNLIEYMPHHSINLGNSGYGRNILEYNEIRHTCLETYDNGSINCWMDDPHGHIEEGAARSGHIIRYNLIADTYGVVVDDECNLITGETTYTKGIYMDGFASNCFVYGNIIVRGGWEGGIRLNGGKNNIIENNIIVDGKRQLGTGSGWSEYAPQMANSLRGNRYCRNIFYRSEVDGINMYNLKCWVDDRVLAECDYNLFFNADGDEYTVRLVTDPDGEVIPLSLSEWQGMGYDTHSVTADPLFVDLEHGDYRLKPESPALALGFQQIDVSRIGPRGY